MSHIRFNSILAINRIFFACRWLAHLQLDDAGDIEVKAADSKGMGADQFTAANDSDTGGYTYRSCSGK